MAGAVDLELESEAEVVDAQPDRGDVVQDVAGDGDVHVGAVVQDLSAANEVAMVGSDSDSSSSSSSGRSRSRGRGNTRVGAAAAAALLSAAAPVNVDEEQRILERRLTLPTWFAMQLQHEGGTVEIMAESGAVISTAPGHDPATTVVVVSGTPLACGRAAARLAELHERQEAQRLGAAGDGQGGRLAQFDVPARLLHAVVGPGGAAIGDVRSKCGGVMIAAMPAEGADGVAKVCIGPGEPASVRLAEEMLLSRLRAAEGRLGPASPAAQPPAKGHAAAPADGEHRSLLVVPGHAGPPPQPASAAAAAASASTAPADASPEPHAAPATAPAADAAAASEGSGARLAGGGGGGGGPEAAADAGVVPEAPAGAASSLLGKLFGRWR